MVSILVSCLSWRWELTGVRQIGHTRLLNKSKHYLRAYLHVSIIVFDAPLAELVQTLPHIARAVVHGRADLAQQSRVLYLFE